jgi:hypothetical protein
MALSSPRTLRRAPAVRRGPIPAIAIPAPKRLPSARDIARARAKLDKSAAGHTAVAAQRRELAETDLPDASTHLRMAEQHDAWSAEFSARSKDEGTGATAHIDALRP